MLNVQSSHPQYRLCDSSLMRSGRDGEREKISWMSPSSVSYYGIYALFKEPFVSREKVTVLNYTRKHYAVRSSMSLVCFKTLIKKCLKKTFLRTAQYLPSLKSTEVFVSFFA